MEIVLSSAAMFELAASHPDPAFRSLLSRLLSAISCDGEFDPGELLRLVVVEPGDTLKAVNAELDFTLTQDWETCDYEGCYAALTYVCSDGGDGLLILIPDRPNIDPALLRLISEMP